MKDEFLYIHGENFTGGTVRVVREKDVRLYGDASQSDEKAGAGGVG